MYTHTYVHCMYTRVLDYVCDYGSEIAIHMYMYMYTRAHTLYMATAQTPGI